MELKNKADLPVSDSREFRIIKISQIFPRKCHYSRGWFIKSTDDVQECAFPGSRWPHNSHGFTLDDLKGNVSKDSRMSFTGRNFIFF